MKRRGITLILALAISALPAGALAVSTVFNGDPVDPSTGLPYEILPGKPLVQPGPDGRLGTADDVTTPAIVGDVDLVVRSGTVSATTVIPPPALSTGRGMLPVGVAGPPNAGGTEIPFTVFLSNGVPSASEPVGRLLAAPDMDGIPVIVAAFADLDGDGVIGPTTHGPAGNSALYLELKELVPVGRAAALFSAGVAHGSIAVRTALPASQGGLTIAMVAMALTGPFDPGFFAGAIPSGPGIATALPFLPERDLNRLIRDRAVPAGPGTTLQQVIQFAAVPPSDAYTLPLDGSSPTIDGAIVTSQPAVRVSFRDGGVQRGANGIDRATLGTRPPGNQLRWRLVPVDRFDNLADPPPGFLLTVHADSPVRLLGQRRTRSGAALAVRNTAGLRLLGQVAPGAADGTVGSVRVEHDGIVVAALSYTVDARADRGAADVTVPSSAAPTIQAGVDGATDRNHDGVVVVAVRAGLYREHVVIGRALELVGSGSEVTFIQGDGTASVLTATAPGVVVRGVTAIGGTSGFNLAGTAGRLAASAAWRNSGAGITLSGPGTEVWESTAAENGGDGVAIGGGATGALCADSLLLDNGGTGASAQSAATLIDNLVVRNATGGLLLSGAGAAVVQTNQSVLNFGPAIQLLDSPDCTVTDNLCALNDDDGLHIDRSDNAFVSANTLADNKGYGLFLRRSAGGDFAAAPGLQAPLGDNSATGNRKGDLFIRPN